MTNRNEQKKTATPQAAAPDRAGPILELRDVYKGFGPLEVLRGVNLTVQTGESLVILGGSGSGKSVTLKVLIGLLRPDRGEVHFHGQRIDNLPERQLVNIRTRIGFVFQLGALFDSLTVAENVAFPIREHSDYDDEKIEQIVQEKLRSVGLEDAARKYPTEISGGQRKRVAIARALATDPEVVFLDEPTTGLDPIRADVMNELVIKLRDELHVTVVAVTHDMNSAFKIAERMVMLYDGKLIIDATPEQIRQSQDPRVREFVEGKASFEDMEAIKARR
jgi:phospholipid/cholesterol/gamma-HCH transport system ATP-binding protein